MTCEEMIDRIHARGRFSGKAGLHRIRALMQALDDPQKKLRFIHIAGTNGKGSTATMIASILRASGYRVGLYTSPYLVRFHERIAVNDTLISDDDLVRLALYTEKTTDSLELPAGEHIGEFEFVTAIAFQYFWEQQCDIVVLETGLGGSYDATNVIDPPEVAVITSISLDHMAVLGNTVAEIARTKAGIIKPGSAVVSARGQDESVYQVLHEACPALIVPPCPKLLNADMQGQTFTLENAVYATTLLGKYQLENAATAITAVKAFASCGNPVQDSAYTEGIQNARIAARMEIVQRSPLILIDGGHNEDGVRATVQSLYRDKHKEFTLVIGMVADKAVETCVKQFASIAKRMIVTQPLNERALPARDLAAIADRYCDDVTCFGTLPQALDAVLSAAKPEDKIAVCGSLYLAGEAEQYFAERQKATKS